MNPVPGWTDLHLPSKSCFQMTRTRYSSVQLLFTSAQDRYPIQVRSSHSFREKHRWCGFGGVGLPLPLLRLELLPLFEANGSQNFQPKV